MIFRAMIGMGLALLLAAHESDLGLGRPPGSLSLPSLLNSASATGRSSAQRTLADVKAEIDVSLKTRGRPFYAL